jgi:hypothetical protein
VVRRFVVFAASVVLFLTAVAIIAYRMLFPALPRVQVHPITYLDQGWTSDQREKFYRAAQGSLIIPYSWFLALEQPGLGNHAPFASEENLLRYNLVPDPASKYNPNHLPVGIGKQTIPPRYLEEFGCGAPPCATGSTLHVEWLSYTCAACHTAQLNYKGQSLIVDGARGRWNFTLFNTTLANLLVVSTFSPGVFDRFASHVIHIEQRPDEPAEKDAIKKEVRDFLHNPAIVDGLLATLKHTYPTADGFGRIDAFGQGSNGQFGLLDKRNILVSNAPVLFPPLWYTHDFDWVMSVSAVRQPLARNIAESWGVNSLVDLLNPDAEKLFDATIPLPHIFWMETLLSVLRPPRWPEQILGKINPDAAKLGRYLYEEKVFENALSPPDEQWCPQSPGAPGDDGSQPCPNPNRAQKGLCARCHAAVPEVSPNSYGKRYWQLPVYKLNVIGTDPGDAVNLNTRQVYTGPLRAKFGGKEKVGIGEALEVSISAILQREDQPAFTGYRTNKIRAPLGYPARPLTGYWATPPYLHNGAVPNLYQLLSPVSERSSAFWTGDSEFDPVNVGYRSEKFTGGFEFVTRRGLLGTLGFSLRDLLAGRVDFQRQVAGNSNLGHEFRDAPRGTPGVVGPYLTPQERLAIIEYMKVMDNLKPLDGGDGFRERTALLREMDEEYSGASSSPSEVPGK